MATTFFGSAATFRTPGNATLVQNLFSVQNNVGSPVAVKIRRIVCQLDATSALTAFMPLVKTTRPPALPTGGHALDKVAFDSTMTSNANVIIRPGPDGIPATLPPPRPSDTLPGGRSA